MILVIGNSLVGSLKKAIQKDEQRITVCATSGLGFRDIWCRPDGILEGFDHKSREVKPLGEYSNILIYADLLNPILIAFHLAKRFYSAAVTESTWRDSVTACHSYKLAVEIKNQTKMKPTIIPRNLLSDWPGYVDNVHVAFEKANEFSEFRIFPACLGTHDLNGRPDYKYYEDALYLTGEVFNKKSHKNHDRLHQNELAGRIIFQNIMNEFL